MCYCYSQELKAASKRKRDAEEDRKRKRARRDRQSSQHDAVNRQPHLNNDTSTTAASNAPLPEEDHISEKPTPSRKRGKQKRRSKPEKNAETKNQLPVWKVSQAMGGRMLDIDPILTADEKYLILAYTTSLQVYSCADSLLLRSVKLPIPLGTGHAEHIISACLSPSNADLVWVASSLGRVWLIDWTTGEGPSSHVRVKCELLSGMTVESMKIGGESRDVPFICTNKGRDWSIVACDIQDVVLKSSKALLSQRSPIHNIQAVGDGRTLVASAERNVLLGSLRSSNVTSFSDIDYEFFSFDCSDDITCLDVRTAERVHLNRASQRKEGDEPVVDVAVGCARGAVFSYNDLLPQLRALQIPKTRDYSLQPRKYHWHRKAVHALKWSRDGEHHPSHGMETQLTIQATTFYPVGPRRLSSCGS